MLVIAREAVTDVYDYAAFDPGTVASTKDGDYYCFYKFTCTCSAYDVLLHEVNDDNDVSTDISTNGRNNVAGIAPAAHATANYYGWVQTWGLAEVNKDIGRDISVGGLIYASNSNSDGKCTGISVGTAHSYRAIGVAQETVDSASTGISVFLMLSKG